MSQDSKTAAEDTIASDYEAVSKQLAALREDMAKLAETVSGIAGRRRSNMAEDIAEGFEEARLYVERSGKSAEEKLEGSISSNPLLAIGLATMAGFMIGALSRR